MAGISHSQFLDLGETMMPMRIEQIRELVGIEVDKSFGLYRIVNSPNSADLTFVQIGDRGYLELRLNPRWIHQFHPSEWPLIEERLENSPFVKEFHGFTVRTLVTEKEWDRLFKSRYEQTI